MRVSYLVLTAFTVAITPEVHAASAVENMVAPPVEGYPFDHLVERAETAGGLIAGAAAVDITPAEPRGMYLAGFGPQREARGVADPIFARALVLADSKTSIALVTLDLVGVLSSTSSNIAALSSADHPERILVFTTHNHHAPDTIGYWGPSILKLIPARCGVDPDYLRYVERMAALAVHKAAEKAQRVELRAAVLKAPGKICRRLYGKTGAVEEEDKLFVLAADNDQGEAVATWVHYDCHAETLWDRNQLISADWPGEVNRFMEWIRGGVSLVTMGPLAGRAPEPVYRGSLKHRFWQKRQTGRAIAETAFQGLVDFGKEIEEPKIKLWSTRLDFKVESPLLLLAARSGVLFDQGDKDTADHIGARVGLLQIGRITAALVPGELTREAASLVKDRLGGDIDITVNLFDAEIGYVMTDEQFADENDSYLDYMRSVSLGRSVFENIYSAVGNLAAQAAAESNVPRNEMEQQEHDEGSGLGPPRNFDDDARGGEGGGSTDDVE